MFFVVFAKISIFTPVAHAFRLVYRNRDLATAFIEFRIAVEWKILVFDFCFFGQFFSRGFCFQQSMEEKSLVAENQIFQPKIIDR